MSLNSYFDLNADINSSADFSENALWLFRQRYFIGKEKTVFELARRVARVVTSAETLYSDDINWLRTLEKNIMSDILHRRFLFNSPCLFSAGAGIENDELLYKDVEEMTAHDYEVLYNSRTKNQQLFACFVISVEDSIEGIFDSVKNAGIISKFGGGVGTNFGHLREKGAGIAEGTGGKATGPVSFMETWNTMGSVVVQGGKRRAALMGMMFDDHPDIEEFIDCKTDDGKLSYFNVSVAISDKLMQAVEKDEDFELHSRVDGSVVKTVKARDLMKHICESAWKRGDPGVFFIDRAREDNILKAGGAEWDIEATNPCGEQPLPNFTSCNLGSINIEAFIEDGEWDWEKYKSQIYRSVYYLDLVIDACSYPLPKIEERTKTIRPVGLGIMGLADAAIKRNLVYGSKEFLEFCESICIGLSVHALDASIKIVTEAGKPPFPENELVKKLQSYPPTLQRTLDLISDKEASRIIEALREGNLRNSRRLTIAPTGSISMLLDTSSSIEPNFAWAWNRRVTKNDGTGFEEREYWHRLLSAEQREEYKKNGKISDPVFVSAHEVSPEAHVGVMGVFAKYIDSAISKTVNLPNSATVEDVQAIYKKCYELGCKGITIYRDGSRSNQPIEVKKQEEKEVKERPGLVVFGKTIKDTTPWGSIYVTLNFDGKQPFETFINVGKSGSELKAMTEALSRIISIGLRSGCNIENFIDTLKGLSGKECWLLDGDDNHFIRSIPDAVAVLLEKLIDRNSESHEAEHVCPECGSPMELVSGCAYCFSCGYSPCK